MANTSQTFKAGEIVAESGEYECLICRQMGKRTTRALESGKICPFCDACGTKDTTYRLAGKPARR